MPGPWKPGNRQCSKAHSGPLRLVVTCFALLSLCSDNLLGDNRGGVLAESRNIPTYVALS